MAAIDPSADTGDSGLPARSTLKLLYERPKQILDDSEGESEDDDEDAFIKALRAEIGSSDDEEDSDESSDDEEENGGPSDPAKSVRARKEAAAHDLLSALIAGNSDDESDNDMDVDAVPKVNGLSGTKNKGKGKAKDAELEDDDSDIEAADLEEVVLCTLDPSKVRACTVTKGSVR